MEIFPALFIQRDLFLLAVEIKCSQDTQRRVSWKEVNRSTSCQWWSAARLPGWICRWLRVRVKTLRMHVFFFQVEILEKSNSKNFGNWQYTYIFKIWMSRTQQWFSVSKDKHVKVKFKILFSSEMSVSAAGRYLVYRPPVHSSSQTEFSSIFYVTLHRYRIYLDTESIFPTLILCFDRLIRFFMSIPVQ